MMLWFLLLLAIVSVQTFKYSSLVSHCIRGKSVFGLPALNFPIQSEKKYCLNVTISVKPERREEFLACIKQNQAGTLSTEPLVRGYTWGESPSEPNTFYFQEQFASEEGFIAHTQTPHFAAWKVFADSEPFTKVPEVKFFREL
jgi:(4S)-4-hydroxy-5-phosphonooxypentane-2,3-dione isomerase